MVTDPIGDYFSRVRNAMSSHHRIVSIPASNTKKAITKILMEKGYILNYKFIEDPKQGLIKIALKYNSQSKLPAIRHVRRVSRPGLRKYCQSNNIPRVLNGLGIAIISTPKGIITDKEAIKEKIGGEVICYIY